MLVKPSGPYTPIKGLAADSLRLNYAFRLLGQAIVTQAKKDVDKVVQAVKIGLSKGE